MDELTYFPDGAVLPAEQNRLQFAEDLRETIMAQILEGQETVRGKVGEQMLSSRLPKGRQLLDFVTLRATDNDQELEVSLAIPSFENEELGFRLAFIYEPPK